MPLASSCRIGSSPHTRGLQFQRFMVGVAGWIIPAHAGFTPNPSGTWEWPPDHPRTRGVYRGISIVDASNPGSSPHTRGLLCGGVLVAGSPRIIPAHAGFTTLTCCPGACRTDHPRTRGVYSHAASHEAARGGSSPHTRGLPVGGLVHVGDPGIIPAHAGFTPPARAHTPGSRGSSPHTRGLRLQLPQGRPHGRIIPAHAGFTTPGSLSRTAPADHPRTRGVYRPP